MGAGCIDPHFIFIRVFVSEINFPILYRPLYDLPSRLPKGETPRPVSAIMVLHDPLDWALEAQVVVDVLRGGAPDDSTDLKRDQWIMVDLTVSLFSVKPRHQRSSGR